MCVIDACTRLAWAEVVTDLKMTVMFSALKSFNLLHQRYQLQFAEVLTDNGSEFAAPAPKTRTRLNGCCWSWGSNIGIPGPIGRRPMGRWSGSGGPLIDGTTFASLAEFELEQYLLYQ